MRKPKEFPVKSILLIIEIRLTSVEMKKVRLGKVPGGMDDRWFVQYTNPWLYFYRSWTGNCIYKVKIENVDGIYKAVELYVNGEKSEYKYMDEESERRLFYELFDLFLNDQL